nr:unnamed protein product [Callosobruchus chinensis]
MHLSQKLLISGRTVVTDNYYTSFELAINLLDKKTHLLGTLRSNRRGNPEEVINKKLKRGEVAAKENNRENPVAVIEYSKAKSSIDLSDQMASYASALRKICLLFRDNDESNLPSTSKPDTRQDQHVLKKKEGCSHKVRRYCKGCYNKKLQSEIQKNNHIH